ncbi:response regulator [Gemmata sp. JC673]|uniref:Response regulator n=1 Tax=Gemmata algarum TaxID=2975278 RepID=A0ABU5F275_9BACT|nr:response regulator [Gemmata algarum]MDY3560837.1 response regulator [Gemmata algarum]
MITHSAHTLSVLIVEDREDVAQSTAELLALHGHTVRVARCGAEALEQTAGGAPDVVLVDIGLPDLDGWAVIRQIRARADDSQPVVVAVTGRCSERDRRASTDAGIDLHLVKPVEPQFLTNLLSRIGDNKSAYLALHTPLAHAAYRGRDQLAPGFDQEPGT